MQRNRPARSFARPRILPLCGAVLLVGLALLPGQARAWWNGPVWVPGPAPVYVGPPPVYVAPPPVYVAPPAPVYVEPSPPAYYPQPVPQQPVPSQPGVLPGYIVQQPAPGVRAAEPGRTCYAGNYTCPLNGSYAPGASCACPTGSGPNAYGRAG